MNKKQKIVDNELFSSPVFRCDICKKLFYDEKIKELKAAKDSEIMYK